MPNYIVASIGNWNKEIFEKKTSKLKGDWFFCSNPTELDELLKTITPRFIFFPHWRWIVPKHILEKNECVCFHMTDLPYGRGGSPLQNLIVRGHKETMLTALLMEEGLDSGPVYLKHKLSLDGNAQEIYQRASILTWALIKELLEKQPKPIPQNGEVVTFQRRGPAQSKIPDNLHLEQLYDYIRMLDAPGYPNAFIDTQNYHLNFQEAVLENGILSAKITISTKET